MKKTQVYVKRLTNLERDTVENSVRHIDYPDHGYLPYLKEIAIAREHVQSIFADLIERSDLSRSYPHFTGTIKIENLPTDENVSRPPIEGGNLKKINKDTYVSENVLVLISSFFGQPYSMYCEGKGLVNNLVPAQTTSSQLTGLGAASDLRFHIENSLLRTLTPRDCSPKALFLTGVCQDETPPFTRVSDARPALALLSDEDRHILSRPLYRIKLPYRWRTFRDGFDQVLSDPMPLIKFCPNGMTVNAALYGDMIGEFETAAAERATQNFEAALEEVAINEIVTPGEILCIDNFVTLHARTPFDATFDDQGRAHRWAQRVFVSDTLDNFHNWEQSDHGVYSPVFAPDVNAGAGEQRQAA